MILPKLAMALIKRSHTLSGRKRTPNSTKGYERKIIPSALGETESSAPQNPIFLSFVDVISEYNMLCGAVRVFRVDEYFCQQYDRFQREGKWNVENFDVPQDSKRRKFLSAMTPTSIRHSPTQTYLAIDG